MVVKQRRTLNFVVRNNYAEHGHLNQENRVFHFYCNPRNGIGKNQCLKPAALLVERRAEISGEWEISKLVLIFSFIPHQPQPGAFFLNNRIERGVADFRFHRIAGCGDDVHPGTSVFECDWVPIRIDKAHGAQ